MAEPSTFLGRALMEPHGVYNRGSRVQAAGLAPTLSLLGRAVPCRWCTLPSRASNFYIAFRRPVLSTGTALPIQISDEIIHKYRERVQGASCRISARGRIMVRVGGVLLQVVHHPEVWRYRAALTRVAAEHGAPSEGNKHQLRMAALYERLARYAEERVAYERANRRLLPAPSRAGLIEARKDTLSSEDESAAQRLLAAAELL